MLKKRILLASLLKPVNDSRMYEKTGISLAKLPNTEVHIAGFHANTSPGSANIFFHRLFNFQRLSLDRLKAQRKYWQLLLQLKPDVIIPNTYELLPLTVLYKLKKGATIIYDVRENYYANIRYQPTFPKLARWLLANGVRLIEKLCAPWISYFWLAEHSYAKELTFLKQNHTVLENKYRGPENPIFQRPVRINPHSLNLLYSGTISEIYGIWEAVALAEKLHQLAPATHLTIIGYCPLPQTYARLKALIADKPYISLTGGDRLVPHQEIIRAIHRADVGLLPYRHNKSTWRCLPTKLFEYAANGLPCLIPQNPYWEDPVKAWDAGFSLDFMDPDAATVLARLTTGSFYQEGISKNVFWQEEEKKMLAFFDQKPEYR